MYIHGRASEVLVYSYGPLILQAGPEQMWSEQDIRDSLLDLEFQAEQVGLKLAPVSSGTICCQFSSSNVIAAAFKTLKEQGARIVIVVLEELNFYAEVKRYGDQVCLPTQCVAMQKIPSERVIGLLMKINMKMGGVNCETTMVVVRRLCCTIFLCLATKPKCSYYIQGIHVHGSVVAMVASMDDMLGQ